MSRWRRGHADRWHEVLTGRLRAAHVIAGLDPVYGGPSYSVPRLCEALAAAGAETALLSVAGEEGGQRDAYRQGLSRLPLRLGLRTYPDPARPAQFTGPVERAP